MLREKKVEESRRGVLLKDFAWKRILTFFFTQTKTSEKNYLLIIASSKNLVCSLLMIILQCSLCCSSHFFAIPCYYDEENSNDGTFNISFACSHLTTPICPSLPFVQMWNLFDVTTMAKKRLLLWQNESINFFCFEFSLSLREHVNSTRLLDT